MKRIEAIRSRAEAGDVAAQVDLGWRFDRGRGVRKSYKKAFAWYLKAARGGSRVAQYNLNLCYLLGQGTFRNDRQAFHWVQKSARAGYPDAILALAWHYHNGRGVRPSLRQAERWYRQSARNGDASAQFSLGQLFFDEGRYKLARGWFLKGAAQEHPRCHYYLGRIYLDGLGVRPDFAKAKTHLRRATALRAAFAKRLLRSRRLRDRVAAE